MIDGVLPEKMAGLNLAKALDRVGIPTSVFKTILLKYAEVNKDKARDMHLKLAEGQLQEVGTLAHALKGSSGNIGADDLYDLTLAVEQAVRSGEDRAVVEAHIQALATELDVVLASIATLV